MNQLIANRFVITDDAPREGGLSKVYRAVDVSMNPPRNVAVKVLGQIDDDELVNLFFQKEVDALKSLHHSNIVEFVDAGRDATTGEAYIVLEWVQGDLLNVLENGPIPFDDFVEQIGLPLASALATAHERQVIHRDVKPSNVLVTQDGVPKLADFGTSKIKSSLSSDPRTTAEFMSRPYAPPEHESTSAYTRDVYGFGVLMLRCLVETPITDYPDIKSAIDELDVSPDLMSLIERCVDFHPETRPKNCSLLYAELKAIHDKRKIAWAKDLQVWLGIGNKARESCQSQMGLAPQDVETFIVNDLKDAPVLKPVNTADDTLGRIEGRQFFLFGTTLSYRVVIQDDGKRAPMLFIMSSIQPELAQLDRARDTDLVLDTVSFRFGSPINHAEARATIEKVLRLADKFAENANKATEERERYRVLDEWRRQIFAREAIQTSREYPANFDGVEINGQRLKLTITKGLSDVNVGEIRRIQSGNKKGRAPTIRGEVDDVEGNVVTLYVDEPPPGIPTKGRLLIDTSAARITIDREKAALSDVLHKGASLVRPELRDLIIDPSTCQETKPAEITEWFQDKLDADKQQAVSSALSSEDMFLVQGPPGTGKTTFIAELVAQELKRNPKALILISSQTNVALDNALHRVHTLNPDARLIRLADVKAKRVTPLAHPFLLAEQMNNWRDFVTIRSQAFLDEWCEIHGVAGDAVRLALTLQELSDLSRSNEALRSSIDHEQRLLAEMERAPDSSQKENEIQDAADHVNSLNKRRRQVQNDIDFKWTVIKDQVEGTALRSDSEPLDFMTAANELLEAAGSHAEELKSLVRMQAEWLLRLGKGDEFVEPLLLGSQVLGATCIGIARYKALKSAQFDLCIIDEASKATATESLVPMVRSKRWVLVGDQRQLPPFQEDALKDRTLQDSHELDPNELERTLFDRLSEALPAANQVMLRTQRRMTKAIGELVSQCFYEGELLSEGPSPLGPIKEALPKAVTWRSTSRIPNRFEKSDHFAATSFLNIEEAREVVAVLHRLGRWYEPDETNQQLQVLVLAPYSGQVSHLRKRVAGIQPDLPTLDIEVNTIDAVQGREADIVIFSVTRSNARNDMGFLNVEARANVALSRAQRGLIIIGDADFCGSKPGPLKKILDHIFVNSDDCSMEEVKA